MIAYDFMLTNCSHTTEFVLDSPGFFGDFSPSYHLLHNSSNHIAELIVLNILRLNSNPPRRITSMEVNGPDLDAFESATHTQIRAWGLGKIAAFIPNLLPNAPVP